MLEKDFNKIECPRCLGKGHVDAEDIKRLKKDLKWKPGSCAYCNSTGKVNPEILDIVPVDTSYLTNDITVKEVKKLLSGDKEAMKRDKKFDSAYDDFNKQIRGLYLVQNLNITQIVNFFCNLYPKSYPTNEKRAELIDHIKKVIDNINSTNSS
ncbi:hypothetical protein [Ferruginibacter sp. SUN106]|uniref:hypothetical protein n=1 Tax=Ferruginibacter sp. SUN106 TaxID=2978348 RepID=UPI003D36D5DB